MSTQMQPRRLKKIQLKRRRFETLQTMFMHSRNLLTLCLFVIAGSFNQVYADLPDTPADEIAQAGIQNLCGPLLKNAIFSISYECLNDTHAIKVTLPETAWRYEKDSEFDGLTEGSVSSNDVGVTNPDSFEYTGFGVLETSEKVIIVITDFRDPKLAFTPENPRDLITHGDLFLNLTDSTLPVASNNKALYGIHFVPNNDSGVNELGLYGSVSAKSVSSSNKGYKDINAYEDRLSQRSRGADYGIFGNDNSYFGAAKALNVIDEGTLLGPIELLTLQQITDLGFEITKFKYDFVTAISFEKSLLLDQCGVPNGDGTSCLDCEGTPCGEIEEDSCGVCGGSDACVCIPEIELCDGKDNDCDDLIDEGLICDEPECEEGYDACGICGGDGSSCRDCQGIVDGTKVPGTPCDTSLTGVCQNGTYDENCECLPDNPEEETCDDIDNDCDGEIDEELVCVDPCPEGYDKCGVCGGDDSSCADCKGVPNGEDVVGVACVTDQPGQCEKGFYDEFCKCTPLQAPEAELCDDIDNDCDGEIDEDAPGCGVTTTDFCVQSSSESQFVSISSVGKREFRVITRAIRKFKRARKLSGAKARRFRKRARTILRRTRELRRTLPTTNVRFNDNCSCTVVSYSGTITEIEEQIEALRRVLERIIENLNVEDKGDGICKDTPKNCIQRILNRQREVKVLRRKVRILRKKSKKRLENLDDEIGTCE